MNNPPYELVDFKDGSLSFSDDELSKELALHDSIYKECFRDEPVQYDCLAFGKNLVEVGSAVTTHVSQTRSILSRAVPVDRSATRHSIAIRHAYSLALQHPERVFAILFQSDGQSTDWKSLDDAVGLLSRCSNVAFVAVTGVIPSSRLRLRQSMAPLGDRFVACDQQDANHALATKLASLVQKARDAR